MSGFYVLDKKIWNFASGDVVTETVENNEAVDSRMVNGKKWKVVEHKGKNYLVVPTSIFSPRVTEDDGK